DPERLPGLELGHQIVIIRVEPLGHLARRGRYAVWRRAAGHAEIRIEIHLFVLPAETRRYDAEQCAGIEHVIVEGKIPDRDEVHSGFVLPAPMLRPQRAAGVL